MGAFAILLRSVLKLVCEFLHLLWLFIVTIAVCDDTLHNSWYTSGCHLFDPWLKVVK
jgi:hypothetical protein